MTCQFDICEFLNVFLGGLIVGIVASLAFTFLTYCFKIINFNKRYKHLRSDKNKFDWISYSMSKDDGRKREDNPNGATANIQLNKGVIDIILKHDNRQWNGQIQMLDFGFGVLSLKYENDHEYGKRDCIISSFIENGIKYDYLFLIPSNNKIYSIEKLDNINSVPNYDYGNEILIRERV